MINKLNVIVIKRRHAVMAVVCCLISIAIICFFINYFSKDISTSTLQQNNKYVILAANDTGMHCYQPDYSKYLILPPGNNLKLQVFLNEGKEARLINSGIEVFYQIINNTTSANKIDFWEYSKDYGYDIAPDIGITGNGLSGKMKLSKDGMYYEATAIPVTPFNDGSTELNPYQLAMIRVTDSKTGKELAKTDNVVVPVSNEMNCSKCHGTSDTDLNILKAHDELSKTQLVAELSKGQRHKCADCHQDNILDSAGKSGILPLSQAIHGFHANKMAQSDIEPECYSCHPGSVSRCYRGVMFAEGVSCVNSKCHGDMEKIASTQVQGRQAWLQEPDCSNCHGEKYSVNTGQLYRNSYLNNNSNAEMNGFILCESCHNGTHAEWKSANLKDNLLPIQLLGYPNFIDKCTVCHEGTGKIHETVPAK
ncbi:MAG: hypothetical protein PHC45_03220 [Clostridiaceae bacterium]|nr:hypothetical protein [Clostridiaceae bacterium]